MGLRFSGSRALTVALVVSALAATIALPSAAMAAGFSLKKPAPNSSSTVTNPKVSVYITDAYGIKGATSFSMKLDGKLVKSKITYKKIRDYKRVTLWFQVTTALKVGTHTVVVRVRNIRKKYYSTTWKFTVKAPTPPTPPPPGPMPVTLAASDCGACHVGYPAAHPMSQCALCHGDGRPQGAPAYAPYQSSAHTLNCSLELPCHGGGGASFPHVLGADCARCHSGAFSGIATGHPIDAEASHVSGSARCTTVGCHLTSLTVEHYRRSIGGVKLSCATCHSSTAVRVVAAIRAGSTRCETCHSLTAAHSVTFAAHTASGTCIATGCHVASAVAVHAGSGTGPGCDACHAADKTPSMACASCHPGGANVVHASAAVAHTAWSATCVTALCHLSDVTAVHGAADGPGCPACHAAGRTASTSCSACHPGAIDVLHPRIGSAHSAPIDGCVSAVCHVRDVTALHGAAGGPGCGACHEAGVTTTISCASCHPGDLTPRHTSATAAHTAAASNRCVAAACHGAGVAALHGKTGGPGCAACHGPGKTASTVCSPCHSTDLVAVHPLAVSEHAAPAGTCVSASCHGSSVTTLHGALGGPGCAACHATGKTLTLTCVTCHTGDLVSLHTIADARHSAPVSTCAQSGCHAANVSVLHRALAESGCSNCHGPGKALSLTCTGCHTGDLTPRHPGANSAHAAPTSSCVTAGCHVSSVATVHGAPGGPGCAACHAPGRTPSKTCAACHPGDVATLHAGAAAAHATPRSTCVQLGCHYADAATLHGADGGPGCAACHAVGVVASIACADCHAGDLTPRHPSATGAHTAPASSCVTAGCHAANAATLHSAAGGPGCAACHAPGTTPSLTCATCHPGNVTTLHASATAAHTPPRSTCVQVGCHYTDVATLHGALGGPGCGACHMTGVVASIACQQCHTGDLTPRHPSATTAHTAPAGLCVSSTCHVTNVATIHATGLGCVDCHGVGTTPSKTCATCHAADLVSLHPAAAASHLAPATTCAQTGCHMRDAARIHAAVGGPGCAACHASGKTPSITCAACHVSFSSTHPAPAPAHTAPAGSCVTAGCHGSATASLHGVAGGPGCSACHAAGKTPSLACKSCHTTHGTTLHPAATASHAAPAGSCVFSGCHTPDVRYVHGEGGGSGCSACHSVHRTATSPGCGACHAAGKTLSITCSVCHPTDLAGVHPGAASAHAAAPGACVKSGCHVTDAATVHAVTGAPGCAACHRTGTTPCLTCSACHPAFTSTHPAPAPSHTAPAGTCVTGNCHVASVVTVHGAVGGPGCAACHATGKTPSVTCSACHAGDVIALHPQAVTSHTSTTCNSVTCHGSDVTVVHGAPGGPGCAACHALGVVASVTCANCHPGKYVTIHATGDIPHIAPPSTCVQTGCHRTTAIDIHGTNCSRCHRVGVTPTMDCAACHPGDPATVHAAIVGTRHTAPAGACVTSGCHAADVAALHGATGGPGCAACHTTGVIPSLDCATCHGTFTASHPVPAEAHTAPAAGQCSVCHDTNVATLHGATGGPSCAACHATAVTPSTICIDCHERAEIASLHPVASHTITDHPCSSAFNCHGSNGLTIHLGTTFSCRVCHMSETAPVRKCTDCHDYEWAKYHASGEALFDYHASTVGTGWTDWGWRSEGWILTPYSRGQSLPCSTCHDLNGTPNLYNFPAVVNGRPVSVSDGTQYGDFCRACHGGTLTQWHAGCYDCHTGGHAQGIPPVFEGADCSSCHRHGGWGWPHGIGWMDGPTL
jgi:hypothetical protein